MNNLLLYYYIIMDLLQDKINDIKYNINIIENNFKKTDDFNLLKSYIHNLNKINTELNEINNLINNKIEYSLKLNNLSNINKDELVSIFKELYKFNEEIFSLKIKVTNIQTDIIIKNMNNQKNNDNIYEELPFMRKSIKKKGGKKTKINKRKNNQNKRKTKINK